MPEEYDWSRARNIVLQRFRSKWEQMSDYMRNLRTLVFQDSDTKQDIVLSPNDAIREVETLSAIGKKVIVAEIRKMEQLQP